MTERNVMHGARKGATLTEAERLLVYQARNRDRPTPWPHLAAQLGRTEHAIRLACDPTYRGSFGL